MGTGNNDYVSGINFVLMLNKKYVKINSDSTVVPGQFRLQAIEDSADKASRFYFEPQSDGLTYAVRCADVREPWSNAYVSRILDDKDYLCAGKLKIDVHCQFSIENVTPGVIRLRCDNKKYWTTDSDGLVIANDTYPDAKASIAANAFFD